MTCTFNALSSNQVNHLLYTYRYYIARFYNRQPNLAKQDLYGAAEKSPPCEVEFYLYTCNCSSRNSCKCLRKINVKSNKTYHFIQIDFDFNAKSQ